MKNFWTYALLAFLVWVIYYFFMPTFAFGFYGLPMALVFLGFILFGLNHDWDYDYDNSTVLSKIGLIVGIAGILGATLLPFITSASMFRSSSYKELIGEIKESAITSDISPIDISNVIIIDTKTAKRLADKKLVDEDRALGSQTEIGKFTLQKVGDKLYYVAPLLHSGFWKWWSNGDKGTPGYLMVNATNEKDVRLVKKDKKGNDIRLVYQENASFGQYINRKVYSNYRRTGLTDYSFEIDDDFKPWYIVTKYEKTIGYSGSNATGVIKIDPETGLMWDYAIDEAPDWIDRIQPEDFISEQLNDWGIFVHGWWNPSDRDKLSLSDGSTLIYGENGRCYFYSGITSVGSDEASVGFVLVDTRTKAVKFYKASGAIEDAARKSAEGAVQEKEYTATFPRPYNINGIFTYVMALKDDGGLIKSVALVSYENYQIVGIGYNLRDALRSFKSKMNSTGNSIAPSSGTDIYQFEGVIGRIGTDIKKGDSYYYLLMDSIPDKVFVATTFVSEELPITMKGDYVKIKFSDTGEGFIDVLKFDNLRINSSVTKKQEEVTEYFEKVEQTQNNEKLQRDAESFVENLPDSIKIQLLNKYKTKTND